jgi:hypothetical protein
MTLGDFANIAIIVQGIFVIVSIGFIWYQLRENTRLTKAANTQRLVEVSAPFYLQAIEDREVAKLWLLGTTEWNTLDEIDKRRYRLLLLWWLIFHENIYYQWKKKLIDEETYTTWAGDFEKYIAGQIPKQRWEDLLSSYSFQPAFVDHLHQLMRKQEEAK